MIDIAGKNKAQVLAALYNNSKPLGMGFLQFEPGCMTEVETQEILDDHVDYLRFDYLKGRVIKTNFSGDELDPWGYDRDNGEGAMARAIEEVE